MVRTLSLRATEHIGKEINVKGWVSSRRDHGGLIFVDIRDHTGILQLTVQPESKDAFDKAQELRDEFVISATGTVKERQDDLKNPNIETGSIEIIVSDIKILNKSDALPIQVSSTQTISEEHRLKYRYLDLRRPKM
ncbi:MAG: OB-fold nucleic acid binding domain-containing protein, partial [bacterium]